MKIIGHRGAAGLALENSIEGIEAAINAGVDAIEFDVRVTKDDKLVLCHDKHTGRVSGTSHHVKKHSLRKLRKVPLHNGQKIATLREAIEVSGNTPLLIEGKEGGWAKPLADLLMKQKNVSKFKVISFNHQELYTFSILFPEIPVFALENTSPFEVIRVARVLEFDGIDINFWLLNPLTYLLARHHKLEIIVYTVNSPTIARFIKILYPNISITTDVPDQFQFMRKKYRRKTNARKNR